MCICNYYFCSVAFTANGLQYDNSKDRVVFGTVLTNEGHGFNETTATFTCPLAGLYFFEYPLVCGKDIVFELRKNSGRIPNLGQRIPHNYRTFGITTSVFLQLNVGDNVTLLSHSHHSWNQIDDMLIYSSFVGILINRHIK